MSKKSELLFRNLMNNLPLAYTSAEQVAYINDEFRLRLLAMASETPDNIEGVNGVEVGTVTDWDEQRCFGLKVKGKNVLLSNLLYALEYEPMPAIIREQYPELTESDWEAASRILYLLVSSFDTWLDRTSDS